MPAKNHTNVLSACLLGCLIVALCGASPSRGEEPNAPNVIAIGEVTGNDVYVRSGPSDNHYTVTKLDAGTRVRVVGERENWYEILPTKGLFSLISTDYVDTADGRNGVVNGNNVRVRTGSSLSADHRYTVQLMLSKGAEVRISGKTGDGYLQIEPPVGATVWISRDFVSFVPDDLLRLENQTDSALPASEPRDAGAEPEGKATTGHSTVMDAADESTDAVVRDRAGSSSSGSSLSPAWQSPSVIALEALDAQTREALKRPLRDRDLTARIEAYREIADSQGDEFAARYAGVRIDQLTRIVELEDSARYVGSLRERAEEIRRASFAERAQLQKVAPPVKGGFHVQGELRFSAIYPKGTTPRRYRLVDPKSPKTRTIGYIEISPQSTIQIEDFVGRYVGVRASAKRIQTGGVNPVPIYIASELIVLQPDAVSRGGSRE